jgi:hypothetical protein
MPAEPPSDRGPSREPAEGLPASAGRRLGLAGLLIELVLPTAVSAALLFVLAGYTSYWDLRSRVGLSVFGMLLVVLSAFLSIRLDAFTLARRRSWGKRQLLNRAGARWRLAKLVLGGVAIPIAVLVAANVVELPGHRTPMSLALKLRLPSSQPSREQELGDAVLHASGSAVKVQGILALQATGSDAALGQLLRLLSDDPTALTRGSEREALSRALASFGVRAQPALLARLREMSPRQRAEAAGPAGDLFERYFADDFAQLELELGIGDPGAAQAGVQERLQGAEADLKQALSRIEAARGDEPGERSLPAFILRTFLAMDLKQDAELLLFARRCASDPAWSGAVRGQALLLVAKLGSKEDLDGLFALLEDPSGVVQLRAMQAIALLQSRLSAESGSR